MNRVGARVGPKPCIKWPLYGYLKLGVCAHTWSIPSQEILGPMYKKNSDFRRGAGVNRVYVRKTSLATP